MSSISTVALSGMTAAKRRLEVSAANVANVSSTGALPDASGAVAAGTPRAYAPLVLVQTASAGGGTATTVAAATPATIAVFDPQASFANADGLVAAPNVDFSQELVGQMIASYGFAANATMAKTDDRMQKTLLDILA